MPDFTVKDPPEYNDEMQMLEPTDPAHANKFNAIFEKLLNNGAFLKKAAEMLLETVTAHISSVANHVTAQDKKSWDAKASTTAATQGAAGLMSAADKKKLDNVKENAEVNQNAFSNITVGTVTIAANGKTSAFTLEAGSNITIAADNATKKIIITADKNGGNADTVDGYHAAHFAAADHGHDGRYYTKTESDNLLKQKAAASHSHTKASITDFPTSMTPTAHNHDERYYTEAEVNNLLAGKAAAAHSHSDYAAKSIYGNTTININRKSGSTVGAYSMALGYSIDASGEGSYGDGTKTTASGKWSHASGNETVASGTCAYAHGWLSKAEGNYSSAGGYSTTASGTCSNAEGEHTTASGDRSHAEGYHTVASGGMQNGGSSNVGGCHAEGYETVASGGSSHAENRYTTASGESSHAEGMSTTASNYASHAGGKYNAAMTTGALASNKTGHVFVIGNGTGNTARSNALSLMYSGILKTAGTITASTAADYAEFFEWQDGNSDATDRVGHFVAMDGDKVRIADTDDTYILGIVSGRPFVLGNGDCDTWAGMYLHDEFNREIMEPAPKIELVEITEEVEREIEEIDEETGEVRIMTVKETIVTGHEEREVFDENGNPVYEGTRPKLNPEYDHTQKYISRFDRPEWAAIGMLGVLTVYDDGSCQANGFCKVANGGIATAADGEYTLLDGKIIKGYRVIERVTDNIVKVVFR